MNGSATIAIVDDDEPLLQALDNLLRACGYQTRLFEDAQIYLDKRDGVAVDLVITDHDMPGLNGLSLIERVRDLGDPIPMVLMSGRLNALLVEQAARSGATICLTKPFDEAQLIAAIEHGLGLSPL